MKRLFLALFAILCLGVAVFSQTSQSQKETKVQKSCKPIFSTLVFNPYPVTFQDPPEKCKDYSLIQGRLSNGLGRTHLNLTE